MEKVKDKIKFEKIINICIKILLIFFTMLALLNIIIFRDNLIQKYNYMGIFLFSVIYILIIAMGIFLNKKIKNCINKKVRIILKVILWIVFIGIQIIYGILISRKIGFDCGVVNGDAIDLVNGKFMNASYYATNNNNIFLLLLLEGVFHIVHFFNSDQYLIASIILNIVFIDIAIIYINKTCKTLFGDKYSFIHYFFSIPMLGLTPYIAITYTDTLSLVYPITIFYYYLCYKKSIQKREKYIIIMTILSVVGLLIKPTNIIMTMAICIIELVSFVNKKLSKVDENQNQITSIKKFATNLLLVILVSVMIYGAFYAYRDIRLGDYISKEDYENKSLPLTHFFMMGLKPTEEEGTYYGYYNATDVENTKSHIGVKAKISYNLEEAMKRLKKMGIVGYTSYLYDKCTWIISDGTFAYGIEGHFYTDEPIMKGKFAQIVQNYSYREEEGYINITTNVLQAFWTMLIFFILMGTILKFLAKKEEKESIYILRISMIGIILFILLFEARARYLINYIPIFIVLGVYGTIQIHKMIKKIKHIKGEKNEKAKFDDYSTLL